jgi:hypothetical protein
LIFTILTVSCSNAIPGDGPEPSGSGGCSSAPSYQTYREPELISIAGAIHLVMFSAPSADQVMGYEGDYRQELALPVPADGTKPELDTIDIPDGYTPSIACGNECIATWTTEQDEGVKVAIRDASGWTARADALGIAIHQPVAAASGDVLLVAWASWVDNVGAQIELRRIDPAGTTSWTLATGMDHGHLSITMTPTGGLVTWQRVAASPDGNTHAAWVDAQLLDETGAPAGAPLELAIKDPAGDYYNNAATVFDGGVFHVVHPGLGDGVPWFVVDPTTRTIALEPLADTLPGSIQQIVAVPDGLVLAIDDDHGDVVHLAGGQVVQTLTVGGPAMLEPLADGSLLAAYSTDDSVFVTSIPSTLDAVGSPQDVAATHKVDDGGCSVGGGGAGPLVGLALLVLVRRERGSPSFFRHRARANHVRSGACEPR